MYLTRQNRQFVRIAGTANLLFLLLSIIFVAYLGYDHIRNEHYVRKAIAFTLGNSICWIVNLFLLFAVVPMASEWKVPRWISFYLISYMVTSVMAILIFHFFARLLSDETPHSVILSPLSFVVSVDTLAILSIELILSRLTAQQIKVENANTADIPDIQLENGSLPVFSLQLTIENAIKHNKLTQEQPLSITIRCNIVQPEIADQVAAGYYSSFGFSARRP